MERVRGGWKSPEVCRKPIKQRPKCDLLFFVSTLSYAEGSLKSVTAAPYESLWGISARWTANTEEYMRDSTSTLLTHTHTHTEGQREGSGVSLSDK